MNLPEPVSKQQLLDVLDDIRARVDANDSFEGSFEYLMPDPDDPDERDADFMLRAVWRVGNSMGQGGMRSVGRMS